MNEFNLAWLFLVGFLLTLIGTGLLLPVLHHKSMLDRPNDRSSHIIPTPHGGGLIVVISVFVSFLILIGWPFDRWPDKLGFLDLYPIIAMAFLAVVSWFDDAGGLSPIIRLICQVAAVVPTVLLMPGGCQIFQGTMPVWMDCILTILIWVWFINLFNFMDGIDGLAGLETLSICIGIVVLASILDFGDIRRGQAIVLAGISVGFLWWNWEPAKVFLGDVGSVPLGFILGWLLLELAADGYWIQALILPLYFLTDATWTLLLRIKKGARFWEAHREHFYQQAIQKGFRHSKVSVTIGIVNFLLICLALIALWHPLLGAVCSLLLVFLTIVSFRFRNSKT